jgi:hypothetical protein
MSGNGQWTQDIGNGFHYQAVELPCHDQESAKSYDIEEVSKAHRQ